MHFHQNKGLSSQHTGATSRAYAATRKMLIFIQLCYLFVTVTHFMSRYSLSLEPYSRDIIYRVSFRNHSKQL